MKRFNYLLLFIFGCLFLSSCGGDGTDSPGDTFFTAKIDGELWEADKFDENSFIQTSVLYGGIGQMSGNKFVDGGISSISFIWGAQENFQESFDLCHDNSVLFDCEMDAIRGAFNPTGDDRYPGTLYYSINGELIYTKFDTTNWIAEGTFYFTAVDGGIEDTLEITEGMFKVPIEDLR